MKLPRFVRLLTLVTITFLVLPFAHSQQGQTVQQQQRIQGGPAPAPKPAPKISKEDNQLAAQMLEIADSASRGFEAPMRSYALLQLGQISSSGNPAKARELLKDAFTASLSIADDPHTKEALQNEIFRALVPLSQEDVEERLAQAEPPVRTQASEAIVRRYIEKKQFGPAIELLTQVARWGEFPYASGTSLLLAMPDDMQAEKLSLLTQAIASYKAHDHKNAMIGGSLTEMIVRFGPKMPPKLALEAIDEILSQAKKSDEKASISISGSASTASFNSMYEYQLFALLPLLRHLDEGRAESLLQENQAIKASLEKYPAGLQTLDPTMTDAAPKDGQRGGLATMVNTGDSAPSAGSQVYQIQEMMRKARQIVEESSKDPVQAVAQAQALPVQSPDARMSPRGQALEGIARENFKENPAAAKQALDELRKIIVDLPLQPQARFLSSAAGLYLQMGEKESADKVVSEGFKLAEKVLDHDLDPNDPNKALKAWWPSADVYRRFIDVKTRMSHRAAVEILKEIKDPEIRTVESIMLARALLGMEMKRVRTEEKTKNGHWIMMSDSN